MPNFSFTNGAPERLTRNYDYLFPLGIIYVASYLKHRNYDYHAENLNHLAAPDFESGVSALLTEHYDYVLTGGNSLILTQLKAICRIVRRHSPGSILILGGPCVTTEPELMLDVLDFDYGIIGEGEMACAELLDCLTSGKPPETVAGIIFRHPSGEAVRTAPRREAVNLDILPFPDFEGFGYDEWLEHYPPQLLYTTELIERPRPLVIMGGRGCPFQCTFCFHDQKFRFRSLDDFFAEVEFYLARFRINTLLILDDCFSVRTERIYEFCRRIDDLSREAGYTIYWGVQMTVCGLSAELLATMKASGCISVSYGFESVNAQVLRSMHKPCTAAEIATAIDLTIRSGLRIQGNFIFGDTEETPETWRETLRFWKEHGIGYVNLAFIMLYPGSSIYHEAVQRGLIKNKLFFIINLMNKFPFNFTHHMTDRQYYWMTFYVSWYFLIHSRPRIVPRLSKREFKCPFCKETIQMESEAGRSVQFIKTCPSCCHIVYIYSYTGILRRIMILAAMLGLAAMPKTMKKIIFWRIGR